MLHGGDLFKITSVDEETGGRVVFDCRVLFWWEEQSIKHDCVTKDPRTKFSYLDRSAMMKETVNTFLISVETEEGVLHRDDLPDGRWSSTLLSSIIRPLYVSYVKATGSSYDQIRAFHGSVKAHFDKSQRIGEYVPSPEVIEFNTLRSIGTLTLSDLRSLSYAEFMKYEIISGELRGKNKGHVGREGQPAGMPTNLMANPNLSASQVKEMVEG